MEERRIYDALEIAGLIARSRSTVLSQTEKSRLDAWLNESEENKDLFAQLQDETFVNGLLKKMAGYPTVDAVIRVNQKLDNQENTNVIKINWRKWTVAASVIVLAGIGIALWKKGNGPEIDKTVTAHRSEFKNDIQPGRAGAILYLPGGKVVNLDTLNQRNLKTIAGTLQSDGKIVSFKASDHNSIAAIATLETPISRSQSFQLPDGSIAWLNASSSIKFPTYFSGKKREIEITGEVYFEVAHDASKPFIVKTPTESVEVLGTHFNINAYPFEKVQKTTLLEGSVKVGNAILLPGQQYAAGRIQQADTSLVVAWKNGYFQFGHETNLEEIMSQMERWYNIKVVYEGIPQRSFFGKIPRNYTLIKALNILEEFNVHFRLEGNTLTVLQ